MTIYWRPKISLMIFKNCIFKYFFFVSTLNSVVGVLCSATVNELFSNEKTSRNSLLAGYDLWCRGNNYFCNFVLFFTLILLFFNLSKTEVSKNPRELQFLSSSPHPPPSPVCTDLLLDGLNEFFSLIVDLDLTNFWHLFNLFVKLNRRK